MYKFALKLENIGFLIKNTKEFKDEFCFKTFRIRQKYV